jgi:hypothetical protein
MQVHRYFFYGFTDKRGSREFLGGHDLSDFGLAGNVRSIRAGYISTRLLNLPLLIDELELVARKAQISSRWEPHIRAIQEELTHVLQVEENFLESLPYYCWAAAAVAKKNHPKEIVELATTLKVHKARYEQLAQLALRGSAKELPKQKEAALRALQRIATIAVNAGFRQEDFTDLCSPTSFSYGPGEWVEKIDKSPNWSIERAARYTESSLEVRAR